MTLIVETGSGLRTSNSYTTAAFVTAYLTNLGRATENSWDTLGAPAQEAALIEATQYIDTRWGQRFKGTRNTHFKGTLAQALVAFGGLPTADQTITVGLQVYKFVAALTTLSNDEVVIGADAAETATNFINAVLGASTAAGITHSKALPPSDTVLVRLEEGSTTSVLLEARLQGTSGNIIPLAETADGVTLTTATFVNGLDKAVQALEFPRRNMFGQDGVQIVGLPVKLLQACAEYAIRAAATGTSLFVDPTVDASGRVVVQTASKVGPISESTRFEEGATLSHTLRPYPVADRLLAEYVLPAGRSFR